MTSTASISKVFRFSAFWVSPLCPLLFAIGYLLTAESYRLTPWILVPLAVLPSLLFSLSLLSCAKRRTALNVAMLFLTALIWLLCTSLGLFLLLVADDPSWFH
ncbi:MAG TPA: hypothetical protein PKH39_15085 [Woeseiaceae bacterium]|nr:hypothetical protein [Woeseiaceae bacterium]